MVITFGVCQTHSLAALIAIDKIFPNKIAIVKLTSHVCKEDQ